MTDKRLAFTLVELSIVLVILGLLVGGVLAGQSLIRASELRSVTTDVTRFQTAINAFRDKYFALPGDMANATSFWPTTCLNVSSDNPCNGDGDGMVENRTNFGMDQSRESNRFWQHLILAGLLEGTSTSDETHCQQNNMCVIPVAGTWIAMPKGKLGQSYLVHGDGTRLLLGTIVPGTSGTIYYVLPGLSLNAYGTSTTGFYLTPPEMYNIDVKMDDGRPANGRISPTSPLSGTACFDGITNSYTLTSTSKICALYHNFNGSVF